MLLIYSVLVSFGDILNNIWTESKECSLSVGPESSVFQPAVCRRGDYNVQNFAFSLVWKWNLVSSFGGFKEQGSEGDT